MGLKQRVTPHVWRHTCATHLLQNQANLRHVQEILEYRSLATTERYLHVTIAELKAAHRRCPRGSAKKRRCPKSPTAYLAGMTKLAEIQDAILHLPPQDREELRHWLDETEEETPQMLAAIDEGLRSLAEKGTIPLEEVRKKISQWATKSA